MTHPLQTYPVARQLLDWFASVPLSDQDALDREAEEAEAIVMTLRAIQRVVQMAGVIREPVPPPVVVIPSLDNSPEAMLSKEITSSSSIAEKVSSKGKHSEERGQGTRRKMAEHIAKNGPCKAFVLAKAAGVSDCTISTLLKKGHPWFERDAAGLIHITPLAHQEVMGKQDQGEGERPYYGGDA